MVRRERRVTIIDDGSVPVMQEYINNKGSTKTAGTPAFESFGSAACFLATHASSGAPACYHATHSRAWQSWEHTPVRVDIQLMTRC